MGDVNAEFPRPSGEERTQPLPNQYRMNRGSFPTETFAPDWLQEYERQRLVATIANLEDTAAMTDEELVGYGLRDDSKAAIHPTLDDFLKESDTPDPTHEFFAEGLATDNATQTSKLEDDEWLNERNDAPDEFPAAEQPAPEVPQTEDTMLIATVVENVRKGSDDASTPMPVAPEQPTDDNSELLEKNVDARRRLVGGLIVLTILGLVAHCTFSGTDDSDKKPKHSPSAPVSPHKKPKATASPKADSVTPPKVDEQMQCLAQLPLGIVIGQRLMMPLYEDTLDATTSVSTKHAVGGIVAMQNTTKSELQEYTGAQQLPPLIASYEEGGAIQTFQPDGSPVLPAAIDAPNQYSAAQYRHLVKRYMKSLHTVGVNMVVGPNVSVAGEETGPFKDYSYGSEPSQVGTFAQAFVDGTTQSDVLPVLDSFIGMGSANISTTVGPVTVEDIDKLRNVDELPFRSLADSQAAILVGNMAIGGLTDGQPASLSPQAISEIRNHLGYKKNILISSLSEPAITSKMDQAEATVKSFEAGVDLVMLTGAPKGSSVETSIVDIQKLVSEELKNGGITRDQLDEPLKRIWAMPQKNIDPCDLVSDQNPVVFHSAGSAAVPVSS